MGSRFRCTYCCRTTNHTRADQYSRADIKVYSCNACGRYRTEDEPSNDWLTLLSEVRQASVEDGKKDAMDKLGYDGEDPEWWEVVEGLTEDEAEGRAKHRRLLMRFLNEE